MPGIESEQHPSLDASRHRLAAIAGTSTCHIVQSQDPVFVPGVWGPYLHACFPGCTSLLAQHQRRFADPAQTG